MIDACSSQNFDPSIDSIQAWIVGRVAQMLGAKSSDIQINDRLSDFGLESVEAFTLSGELSDLLGLKLSPTLAWDFPTIAELAQFLETEKRIIKDASLPR
jgi:acyl carrier protein